jgi:hypothetical protein
MKKKIILLSVICIIILYVFTYKIEELTESSDTTEQIKNAVKQIYLADVEAIRNLSNVATKLQTNGLNIPGTITSSDLNIVNGNASGIFNFGSKANINSLGDINGNSLTVTGDIKGNSLTITGKLINTPADHVFYCAGRQHINGSEILYVLNKDGIVVGKEWGGSGNVYIQGNLTVNTINGITFNANKNRARYIRVGNKISTDIKNSDGTTTNESISKLAIDFWHLIQINVLSNGKNISDGKVPTPVPGPSTDNLSWSGSSIANITNGTIFSDKPNADNDSNGYLGSRGRHLYEIDLGEERNIDAIELYNRYRLEKDENKANKTTYDVPISARMNGTIIELIGGDKNKPETLIINRRIHTGLWNLIYSKEYLL